MDGMNVLGRGGEFGLGLGSAVLASAGGGQRLGLSLLVILATAAIVATIFRRLKLESIPGYLIAGAIVGPHALGLIPHAEGVKEISDLAIVLLMFGIGLHLDISSIQRGLVSILSVGIGSTLAFVAIAWGVLSAFGVRAPVGLTLALAMGVSSTAILVRTLMSRRETTSTHGRVAIGVSISQDLLSVVMLASLPALAQWAGSQAQGAMGAVDQDTTVNGAVTLFLKACKGLGGVTLLIVLGRIVLPKMLAYVARLGSGELMLVTAAAIAIGAAVCTSVIGFSAEMGAFIAGFLLALTPFRYQLSGQIAPMRDLLLAVFFTTVGLAVEPRVLVEHLPMVLGATVGVIVFKALIIGFAAWLAGLTAPAAWLTGVYQANAGEFSLVVLAAAAVGTGAGVLSGDELGMAISVVMLSLIVSPQLVGPANLLSNRLARLPLSPIARRTALGRGVTRGVEKPVVVEKATDVEPVIEEEKAREPHVIIAGYGPVGRTLADRFAVMGIPYVVVELNPRTVERQAVLGKYVVYGDITTDEVLESAGIHEAAAVILTIPDDAATLRACEKIRATSPTVYIAARTSFLSGKFTAHQLGADLVTVEEIATAQAMERDVLSQMKKILKGHEGHSDNNHQRAGA